MGVVTFDDETMVDGQNEEQTVTHCNLWRRAMVYQEVKAHPL